MTPEQALNNLSIAAKAAKLSYEEHAACALAYNVLLEAITPKTEKPVVETKPKK